MKNGKIDGRWKIIIFVHDIVYVSMRTTVTKEKIQQRMKRASSAAGKTTTTTALRTTAPTTTTPQQGHHNKDVMMETTTRTRQELGCDEDDLYFWMQSVDIPINA